MHQEYSTRWDIFPLFFFLFVFQLHFAQSKSAPLTAAVPPAPKKTATTRAKSELTFVDEVFHVMYFHELRVGALLIEDQQSLQ